MRLAALLLAALPLAAQPDRFSLPTCASADQELADRSFFLLCHSSARKVPVWTGQELKPEDLEGRAPRPKRFRRDSTLPGAAATDADYRGSGFSRGHMVPAEDLA